MIVILLFLFTQTLFGQKLKMEIDSISKIHFTDSSNVGLSIGVIENGKVSTYYYGGKYTHQIKDVDSTTLFEIGSVTKLYTAFILASLETEKKIKRIDLLSKYLPKDIVKGKEWANKIRLIDLATHTSGLPEFDNTKSLSNLKGFDENNPYALFTEDFMMSVLKNTDSLDSYGKVRYSNFGIGILAYAMSRSEKTSFNLLFKKYVTNKLNLKSTFLKVEENQITNIAIPHRKKEVMPLIQLAELSPAGSIKTTMSDLLNFLNIHLKKENKELKDIVEMVLKNQLENQEQAVGLGWGIHQINNETVYFHNGGTYGSSSIVILIPSKNSAVAILANNADTKLTSYALKLVNKIINKK
ncbi:serine hydrolase [Flavobacteriaceae bacterium W22]|nr:serine hydrolase [Flavobacteriaceae bacterium W22]